MTSHLRDIARRAMIERGFLVDPLEEVFDEVAGKADPLFENLGIRDLSPLLWSSIDNDDTRDLDQLEYAETDARGTRIYIAIAEVDWFVPRDSHIDAAARHNTTSVYTGAVTFPMLPERLSTDLTSLNEGVKRLAVVVEMLISMEGHVDDSSIYPGVVQNRAQLNYNAVAPWLEDNETQGRPGFDVDKRTLDKIRRNAELQAQLRLQNAAAQRLRKARYEAGALSFKRSEMTPVFSEDGDVVALEPRRQNAAALLIEDFMIATNQATAKFLEARGFPSLRRVVHRPERWEKIAAIAAAAGHQLPEEPDAKSLEEFLRAMLRADPAGFGDLSLTIIKLLGRGQYVAHRAGSTAWGHFSLAANAYSHSTAPNRRFPDLVTQRLLNAALSGGAPPYSMDELETLAVHCTERENSANKVERLVKKCAAAILLSRRLGERFDGVVTGVTSRGTWVRISHLEVEGKVVGDTSHVDVGDRIQVRLVSADPERGFIDFELS